MNTDKIQDLTPGLQFLGEGSRRLYHLIRDVFVAFVAIGGAFLWQISPQVNLISALFFGLIGTAGFAVFGRDTPVTENINEV